LNGQPVVNITITQIAHAGVLVPKPVDAGFEEDIREVGILGPPGGEILQDTILPRLKPFFSGDYTTTRCEVRFAEEFN
jgi:hypothetical protein